MLLALDIRNGEINLGFYQDTGWEGVFTFSLGRSSDEYALFMENAALRSGVRPQKAWISSVVPALTATIQDAVKKAFDLDASIIGPGVKTGIKIRTDNPAEMGSDIVCAAVAARALSNDPMIIVDFGTVLCFSAVNELGELLGVAIAPGPEEAGRTLRKRAAQLPEVLLDTPPSSMIGKNTKDALKSGILFGYSGLVARMVEGFRAELGKDARIVSSGNNLARVVMEGQDVFAWVDQLVLEGLAIIAAKN